MMCGIDEAVRIIREADATCGIPGAELIVNRLEYHRNQADGQKPKYHKGDCIKDWYTCRNCGRRAEITFNFCPGCGYRIMWDSTRCLTGLPLVDMAEMRANDETNHDRRTAQEG